MFRGDDPLGQDRLTDHRAEDSFDVSLGLLFEGAEASDLVVAHVLDLLDGAAPEDVDEIDLGLLKVTDGPDDVDDGLGDGGDIPSNNSEIAGAVVARSVAQGSVELLAEVLEHEGASAVNVVFTEAHDDVETFLVGSILIGSFLGGEKEEILDAHLVGVAVVEDAVGDETVSASTATFLVIALEVFGDRVVDHKADIDFVDAHAESDGGDHDLELVFEPVTLSVFPVLVINFSMIVRSTDSGLGESVGHFLGFSAGETVDDAAFAAETVLDDLDDVVGHTFGLFADLVVEVLAVEGGLEDEGVAQFQLADDVLADLVSGGGCEGHDRDVRKFLTDPLELEIMRTKVATPLTETMGLVDHKTGEFLSIVDAAQEVVEESAL